MGGRLRGFRDTDRAVSTMRSGRGEKPGVQAFPESLPSLAGDPEIQRGLRWESLQLVSGVTPCLNRQRVVFGPDQAHTRWIEQVRSSLVRSPSEDALFDLALLGIAAGGEPSLLSRFFSLCTGGGDAPGGCAQLLVNLPMIL